MNSKNEVFEYLIDQLRQQVNSNPYKQQCEDLVHEVQSLKNQLRDMSARETELQKALNLLARQEAELNACPHTNTVGLRKGFAPGFTKKCLDCGAKLK